jgi:hypothetical protein
MIQLLVSVPSMPIVTNAIEHLVKSLDRFHDVWVFSSIYWFLNDSWPWFQLCLDIMYMYIYIYYNVYICLLICIDFLIYLCIFPQPFMIFSCGFVHGHPGFKAITHGAKPQPAPLEPRPRLWQCGGLLDLCMVGIWLVYVGMFNSSIQACCCLHPLHQTLSDRPIGFWP